MVPLLLLPASAAPEVDLFSLGVYDWGEGINPHEQSWSTQSTLTLDLTSGDPSLTYLASV